jgi:NADH-quinone oxidoreductase subunit G
VPIYASITAILWFKSQNSIQSEMKFQSEINGPLRGGDPGVRLLEPRSASKGTYFGAPPAAVKSPEDQWLVVPLYHIFGSEELGRLAPAVAELAPKPYLALNSEDSQVLQLTAGDEVELKVAGSLCRLAVEVRSDLPRGMAGLPA